MKGIRSQLYAGAEGYDHGKSNRSYDKDDRFSTDSAGRGVIARNRIRTGRRIALWQRKKAAA